MAGSVLQHHRWVQPVKLAAPTTSKQTEHPSLCLHQRGAQTKDRVGDPELSSNLAFTGLQVVPNTDVRHAVAHAYAAR